LTICDWFDILHIMSNRTTLVEMIFGSHLYGTNTPSSDKDYKGVFIPSKRELYFCRTPKSISNNTKTNSSVKNSSNDVDRELYSLPYFFELAKKGETVALDMLHAPSEFWITFNLDWVIIHKSRHLFYTRKLSSFVGYARTQAAKYGIKGSRLADAKNVLESLRQHPKKKIHDVLHLLPVGEHCGPSDDSKFYEVCGKKMTLSATTDNYVGMLQNFVKEFGERARQAETNQGIDWKAISHAFRAAFQVKDILTHGDFTYPLKQVDFLKQIKNGELHFSNVSPMLENLMVELEELSEKSLLPDTVNDEKCDNLLYTIMDLHHKERE